VIISELPEVELKQRLRTGRFHLKTGPILYALKTEITGIPEILRILYADFPVVENEQFADFHVTLTRSYGPLGLFRPGARFVVDGGSPFPRFRARLAPVYLEWGLNWCVYKHLHRFLIIHAATVERKGKAIMVVGPSGSGKSTLCAGLSARGWRLLSDEFALICPHRNTLSALARPISLKNESIDIVRHFAPDLGFGPRFTESIKGTIAHVRPSTESVKSMSVESKPAWIIFPNFKPDADLSLTELPKGGAMMKVAELGFNYEILGQQGFQTLSRVVDSCDAYTLTYCDLSEALSLIEQTFSVTERNSVSRLH